MVSRISEYVRTPIVRWVAKRIFREEHDVCEGLQSNAPPMDGPPRQSALETRIGWFEQSYRELVAQGHDRLSAPP